MKGDFSRDSFDRLKHFRRVLMQQGRVQVDADWNEQVSILLHYIQTLAADIIGPYAGPESDWGFSLRVDASNNSKLLIGKGRYYVAGILCENENEICYTDQSYDPTTPAKGSYIVYLDVWERHLTCLEDDHIREKALGGLDTATRTKTVWQVRMKELTAPYGYDCLGGAGLLDKERVISKACLRVEAKRDQKQLEPCLVEPEARYRGLENQLYRVEVHDGGSVSPQNACPTFKWSRENGSVAFPIKAISYNSHDVILELESFGRDDRFGLTVNDWVEIEDEPYVLNTEARPLLQVQKIDRFEMTVTLEKKTRVTTYPSFKKPVLLRRWDQKKDVTPEGVLKITESDKNDVGWLEIEHGIKIQFEFGGIYRKGDYWLIPARTALGDVEWPKEEIDSGELVPKSIPPHGVMHNLAPLAIVSVNDKSITVLHDCRCKFRPLSYDCCYDFYGQLGIGVDLLYP